MNKNKIIMAAAGGVALVVVLAVGFLTFSAMSEQTEINNKIEEFLGTIAEATDSEKITPNEKSISEIEASTKAIDAWYDKSLQLIKEGDIVSMAGISPSLLRKRMSDDIDELSKLPIKFTEAFQRDDFIFKRFIYGGEMPEAEKILAYERQWQDITILVRSLANCGAAELVSVKVVVNTDEDAKNDKKGKNKNKKKKVENKDEGPYSIQAYQIVYRARPAAQIKFLNDLASCKRFVTTQNLSFFHIDDPIVAALTGEVKADESKSARGRGRGRNRARAEEENKEEGPKAKTGFVFDVSNGGLLEITLDLATVDFKTGAEAQKAAPQEEAATEKEESK